MHHLTQRSRTLALVAALGFIAGACSESTPPAVATTLAIATAAPATAPVGTPVSLAVRVDDQNQQPMANVPVTFAVSAGGGSVSTATINTSSTGIAVMPAWTLGTVPGLNSLTATVGTLTPLAFTVTAVAGAPAQVTKTAGDNQSAAVGTAVPVRPAVRVTDAFGNVIANAAVTFAVASGGGSVTGGAATTNASGNAVVGNWILGPALGVNTLTATAGTVTATFTATGTADPCLQQTPLTVGGSVNGTLSTSDCVLTFSGTYMDLYTVQIATAGGYEFRQNRVGGTLDSYLLLVDAAGRFLGENDDDFFGTGVDSRIKAILPAGTYGLAATSFGFGETGAYTVQATAVNADNANCDNVFVTRGITTAQTLTTTDCAVDAERADVYVIRLRAGEQLIVDATSTAFKPKLELYDINVNLILSDPNAGRTDAARLTYTSATSTYYYFLVWSVDVGGTGAYQLTVGGSAPPLAMGDGARPSAGRGAWLNEAGGLRTVGKVSRRFPMARRR